MTYYNTNTADFIQKPAYNRSAIITFAYALKAEKNISFGEAQKMAWQIAKGEALKAALEMGAVEFTYINAEGEKRKATGSNNPSLTGYKAYEQAETVFGGCIAYFDFEKEARRQCKIGRIVKISKICVYTHAAKAKQTLPNVWALAA